jgi:HSP20 family protein
MARSFTLGSELDEQAVQARFDNGVLTLTLPKKQPPAARRITIQ